MRPILLTRTPCGADSRLPASSSHLAVVIGIGYAASDLACTVAASASCRTCARKFNSEGDYDESATG